MLRRLVCWRGDWLCLNGDVVRANVQASAQRALGKIGRLSSGSPSRVLSSRSSWSNDAAEAARRRDTAGRVRISLDASLLAGSQVWDLAECGVGVASLLAATLNPILDFVIAISTTLFLCAGVTELLIVSIVLPRKANEEVRAGYTSLPRKHQGVAQVIPDTNLVIREAGEPYIGLPAEYANYRAERGRADAKLD